MLTGNQRFAVSIFVTILIVLGIYNTGYADITPVSERTSQVRDAIVTAAGVNTAADVTETHLGAITSLNLRAKSISALNSGDFSGLTGLTSLNLYGNELSSLPDGIFKGLTALTTIRLGRNIVNPLPLTVLLEKVGKNQFKAVAPPGATFDIVLPITVTNGNITGGATTLTIQQGNVESDTLTVTRTVGTTTDVTVDIGVLPNLPRSHYGYALSKSDDLPLAIITSINTAPVFTDGTVVTRTVAENTAAAVNIGTPIIATDVNSDTLTYTLGGTDASAFDIDSSTGQLKTKAALDYETKNSYTVTITVSDDSLTDTITVTINVTDINEVVTVDPPTTPDPPTTNTELGFLEGDSTTRVVLENTPAGTNIGNTVSATDTVGDLLAYTLGGVDADSFDIDSNGQLKTKAPLDYETKRVYSVTITVDYEELSDTITVLISVIDVNDTVVRAGFVPAAARTPQVRDAIVAAVPNVTDAASVTESQVAAIRSLNLRSMGISSLKIGDFSGMTALANLNLFSNQLSKLPPGIFDGLTALTTLRLGGNVLDPLPLVVSLQSVGIGKFRAMITTGAPFNIVLPLTATTGSISGGATSVTIPQGSTESASFTLIGTSAKVSFASLPGLPSDHFGYTLAQSTVCNRTAAVADAISKAVGVSDCSDVTEVDLATITRLDLSGSSITSLQTGDFDGMFSLRTLYLENNELTNLPSGIFDDLASLNFLSLNDNKLITLPGGIFSNLTLLTALDIFNNDISSLPRDVFEGLSSLRSLSLNDNELMSLPSGIFDGMPFVSSITLSNNKLTFIPNGIFEGLMQLSQLHLSLNPNANTLLSLRVSLQKVGTNRLKAVVPSGAPFTMTIPVKITNGVFAGGTTTITIPIGTVESQPLTITRTAGTVAAVTANIGTPLPRLPSNHNGYGLVISGTSPLEVLPSLNSAPVFTEGVNTIRAVAENTAAGVNIGDVVAATDVDSGDTLTYTLGGTDASAFSINSTTGQLRTSASLDYETKTSYTVTVSVSDGKGGSDSITVTINVTDVTENTNNAPVFTDGSSTTRFVAENTAANTNIGSAVAATDADEDTLSYNLSGADASAFGIDTATGQLKTKAVLDYETKTSYSITITVSDGKLTASITVTISVNDVDELPTETETETEEVEDVSANNAPVFTDSETATRTVVEDTPSGVDIGTAVSATDADGNTLSYRLGGTDASSFSINSTTGQLRTSAPLDYETKSSYTVTLTVTDGTDSTTIRVTINVINKTENRVPLFTDGTSTTRSVAENTGSGVDIGTAVSATDADGNTLSYRLGGTDAASFSINSTTGQLRTSASLDYEAKIFYTVTVSVSDGNGGSDSITVTINVTDITETPITPVNERTQQVQDAIVAAIDGVDSADDVTATHLTAITTLSMQYKSITSLKSGDFDGLTNLTRLELDWNVISDISPLEGLTSLTTLTLSFNEISDISPLVGLTNLATLTLSSNDISDISPLVGLTALTRLDLSSNEINDISALGGLTALTWLYLSSNEISDISAFEGLRALTWLDLSGNSLSNVSPLVGLRALTRLDLFNNEINDISALGGLRALTWLTLFDNEISDVSALEGLTNLTELYLSSNEINDISALEGLSALTWLTLSSNEISDVSALEGLTNLTNLMLSGNSISDYGPLRRLIAAIEASGRSLDLDITIPPVIGNNSPVFTDGSSTTRSVAENTTSGANIGSAVAATDADSGDTLTYSLGGADAASFSIVPTSGQLQTSSALDYETKTSYTVIVSVSDGKGGSDSITVTINVTDVTENINNAPVFTDGSSTTRSVAENTTSGANIGSAVAATDADSGDTLTYSLGGADAASFSIVPTSGQLQTSSALDYETKTSYTVIVSVSDGKGGSDSITVTINVTDVTENINNAPVFTDGSSTTRSVAENTASGQNIGSAVGATDADSGDTLTYSLGGADAASFSIVPTSGQLQTSSALNYETKTSYTVIVSVSDGKGGSDSITVTINVTDVTENTNNAPIFTDGSSTTRSVAENTASGENIGSAVAATDADSGNTLTYSLGGADAASFSIAPTSGQLQTSSALDYETKTSYTVIVSVSDGKGGSDSITVTINVTDVTENINNAPVFTDGSSTTRSVAENTASGQNIGSAVGATDADSGDTLTYSLGGADAASFSIVPTSGQLQTSSALNYETKTSYTVIVSVSDGKGGSDSITVTINVTDVTENTNNAPIFTDGSSTTRSVAENTASGENIGSAVAATDADSGNTLTYSLGGADAASFSIAPTSGQLQTSSALDYETKTSYTVIVSVSDGKGGSDSITVTINVTKVTDTSITLINQRTQQVQDAIVAAIDGVDSADDVTATHLTAITTLSMQYKSITSLKSGDFDGLTNLTRLELDWNVISDISPLEGLTSLTTLTLSFNEISDISPLGGLTNLATLDLSSNDISDISALVGLTNLATLILSSNDISDILALGGLTNLTRLYLSSNDISDISALGGLRALTWLDLSGNSLSNVSPLVGLTALTRLDLFDNEINDISALGGLRALTWLTLFDNEISDISALGGLTNLTELYLSSNEINDISALEGLSALTWLTLSSNEISDVSALEGLTNLTNLMLSGNSISDYGPLRRLIAAIEASGRRLTLDITIPPEGGNNAPTETSPPKMALLANFPNPFNPETWIPYQLSKSAKVTLTIYSMRGVVVRQLKLGQMPTGVYRNRSRAIHWDGKNSIGEKVAAGVYFYTFTAGDFSATRKMLIRK